MRSTVVSITVAVLLTGSVLVPSVRAGAQTPQTVHSIATGTRVRITAPSALTPAQQAGRLLSLQPDTLVLMPDGSSASLSVPLAEVTSIEVSRRQHRSTVAGTFIGVLAGGLTGIAVGAAAYQNSKPSEIIDPIARSASAAGGGVLGAVVGGVVGGLVGHAHQSESWTKVPFAQRAAVFLLSPNHLSITPIRGGVALSVGLRFGGV